jgi:hypothetical protein
MLCWLEFGALLTRVFAVLAPVCCLQDLASQAMEVAKGTKGLDEVVDTIREHEMAILNSLVGDKSSCCACMRSFRVLLM